MKTLKVIYKIILIVGLLFVSDSALASEIDMNFSIGVSSAGSAIQIVIEPWTPGMPGDGFVINYQGVDYFLREGRLLILPRNRLYSLYVSRVYRTGKGLLIGNGQSITLNPERKEVYKDELRLPRVKSVFGWMLAPNIYANFSSGKIAIEPYIYGGPPIVFSRIEVSFSGYRKHRITSYVKRGEIDVPRGYTGCRVALIFDDEVNNRIIRGESSSLNFIKE